jgi:hypothetical protein
MTLLISVATDDAVIQASDRRLTWLEPDGSTRPIDDNRNKAVVLGKPVVFAYTGLANLGPRRQRTDDWLAEVLHEGLDSAHEQGDILDSLASAGFPDSELKVFRPYLAVVSNFRDDAYRVLPEPQSKFQLRFGQLRDDFSVLLGGQGLEEAHEQEFRADVAGTGGNLEAIADLLVHHIREAADRNSAIGKGVLLTVLPRAAVVEGDASSLLRMGGGRIDKVPTFRGWSNRGVPGLARRSVCRVVKSDTSRS